ncbi:helix-turn-helix domain-containing protein [Lentzea sp. BCCO 10_0856]|uniref:Helix-turn-helix domain-containing protein n=1 Tax=Lentzea miocenica TaxID=3095431 RepID=A0ABU4T3S9_9PSEU|nr:helix-turn-helix domain-containing protein [Lentzea sp. BCCO 10_0856]MDX8032603.1 helix-turn-helix domain-containing protein [Lentzea sp. BCCO 10_0856]
MPDVKHFDPDAVLDEVMALFWRRGAASTGIQDIVTATGLNRSSLYSTFGGKRELYLAALRRYVHERSQPIFARLIADDRGLAAIEDFFAGLITTRCSGAHARWGCMVANGHANGENDDADISAVLREHHDQLSKALHIALEREQQLRISAGQAADMLAMLAYGVNLRSRAGADEKALNATVKAALSALV